MLLSGLETLFILLLLIALLYLFDRNDFSDYNLFFFLLISSIIYFVLIGVTTPVLGNLVRYKAPLLPLFVFALALKARPVPLPHFLTQWLLRKE